jgi:hypothetical protein
MSTAAQPFCRQVNDYSGLVEAVRDRSEQMEISRNELDRISGLADGHVAKIVSPHPTKKFGILSLGAILQTLGLILVVVEDPAARDRTLARRTPFDAANRRVGNTCRASKEPQSLPVPNSATEPARVALKPIRPVPAAHAHLHVVQSRVKGAGRWGGAL